MIKYGLFFIVILAAGCTSMDVRPIPAAAKLDKVCIKFNDDVNVDDFVSVMQEDFADHGVTSVVFKAERPKGCEFTLDYTVDRWWDLAPYMVDARMIVNKDVTDRRNEAGDDRRNGATFRWSKKASQWA